MKDWDTFARTCNESATTTGTKPSTFDYLLIKATDNALAVSVFILIIFFSAIGLFFINEAEHEKSNFALHAAELCIGIFFLAFSNRISDKRNNHLPVPRFVRTGEPITT